MTAVGGVNTRAPKAPTCPERQLRRPQCHRRVRAGFSRRRLGPPPGPLHRRRRLVAKRFIGCVSGMAAENTPRGPPREKSRPWLWHDDTHAATVAAAFVHPCWAGPSRSAITTSLCYDLFPGIPPMLRRKIATLETAPPHLPGPKLDGTGGSGGAAAAGTELLFRGFGPTDPKAQFLGCVRPL